MGRDGEHRRTGFVFPLSTRINSQHKRHSWKYLSASCCAFFVNMFYIMLSER